MQSCVYSTSVAVYSNPVVCLQFKPINCSKICTEALKLLTLKLNLFKYEKSKNMRKLPNNEVNSVGHTITKATMVHKIKTWV